MRAKRHHVETGGPVAAVALVPTGRRTRIVELVAGAGFMTVGDIAAAMGVSSITIRRDLAALEVETALKRTHGGAVLSRVADDGAFDPFEPAFEARRRRNMAAKEAIALEAARRIAPGETLALDVGTTALAFARALNGRSDLKVVTSNLRAAGLLADSGVEVYVPGGRVREREHAVGGARAVGEIASLWFDTAIIGASGIGEDGLFDYSPEDTEVKRAFMGRAARVVVIADATKFGRRALVRFADLTAVDLLVTDQRPGEALAGALALHGTEIVLAR